MGRSDRFLTIQFGEGPGSDPPTQVLVVALKIRGDGLQAGLGRLRPAWKGVVVTSLGSARSWSLTAISTLLQALGTRCRHQCRLQGCANVPAVERLTEPSALQQRALVLVRTVPEEDNSKSS